MAQAATILRAVESIHEAVLTLDGWRHVVSHVAAATGSQRSSFLAVDPLRHVTEFITGHETAPDHLARLAAAAAAGRLPAWFADLQVGCAVQSSSMQSDRDFARSLFYNEAVRPLNAFYGLAVVAQRVPHRHVYMTAGRRLGQQDYDAEDVSVLQTLMPHVTTALRVSARLADADLHAAAADTALDRLDVGVILVDAAGAVLYANHRAAALFARDGVLRLERDGLDAIDAQPARQLRRLIAACGRGDAVDRGAGGSVDVSRGDGRLPLRVLVSPFPTNRDRVTLSWLGAERPAAILLVSDLEHARESKIAGLRARYDLTRAEADVALEIAVGDGREAAAARLRIALPTLATHLQRVFEKTGTHRQAELSRLLVG